MKKLLSLSLLSLAIADVQAADSVSAALQEGKAGLQFRPRAEWVDDQAAAAADPARALTMRSVLSYRTAAYEGITGMVEVEDIRALDDRYHVPVVQPRPAYAAVVDPESTAVNQAWLAGYGFKVGQQKLIFNNARFIGDVGWRQNDQTFLAAAYEQSKVLPWLDVQLAYATQAAMINSQRADLRLPVVNLKARTPVGASVTLFWAGLTGREAAGLAPANAGLLANAGVDRSREYRVVRVDGKHEGWLYDLSYGQQRAYADGTATHAPDAAYRDIQLGYDFGVMTVKLQQERLGAKFQTPLATLHAFNGWADRFLVTPDAGLEDRNIKLAGKALDLNLALAWHHFSAVRGGTDFGREVDASVGKTFTPQLSGLVKVALFQGSQESTGSQAGYSRDLAKAWVQLDYRF